MLLARLPPQKDVSIAEITSGYLQAYEALEDAKVLIQQDRYRLTPQKK